MPKLSMGAICFTFSSSRCWVVLVFLTPPPHFLWKKLFFYPCMTYTPKEEEFACRPPTKKSFRRKKAK